MLGTDCMFIQDKAQNAKIFFNPCDIFRISVSQTQLQLNPFSHSGGLIPLLDKLEQHNLKLNANWADWKI